MGTPKQRGLNFTGDCKCSSHVNISANTFMVQPSEDDSASLCESGGVSLRRSGHLALSSHSLSMLDLNSTVSTQCLLSESVHFQSQFVVVETLFI